MVTSLQKPTNYLELEGALNFPVYDLMLPNSYVEGEYNPFPTPFAPDEYGQSYARDMVDHWTLQWQGAVQYGINNFTGMFENDPNWNPLDEKINPYFDEMENYQQFIEDFAMTKSKPHFEYIKGRIDGESIILNSITINYGSGNS
jgi:hypothetical protein